MYSLILNLFLVFVIVVVLVMIVYVIGALVDVVREFLGSLKKSKVEDDTEDYIKQVDRYLVKKLKNKIDRMDG